MNRSIRIEISDNSFFERNNIYTHASSNISSCSALVNAWDKLLEKPKKGENRGPITVPTTRNFSLWRDPWSTRFTRTCALAIKSTPAEPRICITRRHIIRPIIDVSTSTVSRAALVGTSSSNNRSTNNKKKIYRITTSPSRKTFRTSSRNF